jgi:protein-tyrosine phosphatase
MRICFVCLGNICRSPLAEGIFSYLIQKKGLDSYFQIDSAGIGEWNVGQSPDTRTVTVAANHGVVITGQSRQFVPEDFSKFDLIIAMDSENKRSLLNLAGSSTDKAKVHLLREYDIEANKDLDIPDPYYQDNEFFENVYQMIERSCRNMVSAIYPDENNR